MLSKLLTVIKGQWLNEELQIKIPYMYCRFQGVQVQDS